MVTGLVLLASDFLKKGDVTGWTVAVVPAVVPAVLSATFLCR